MELPIEMVEEILLNLPVKSLLRFSSVSKTWNSMIWRSWFVKRYRRRAALPGRERIALVPGNDHFHFSFGKSLPTYDVSSISSSMSSSTGTGNVVCEFADRPIIMGLCDELWLVGFLDKDEEEIVLWNPSMRKHKKLPKPSVVPPYVVRGSLNIYLYSFAYGLGYDVVGDDYKILKIPKKNHAYDIGCNAELYSLRSDSWREIPNFSRDMEPRSWNVGECVFVSGNLHWLPCDNRVIVSFDLSTEKFGEVDYPPTKALSLNVLRVDVLRGMLCVTVNEDEKCFIWVMEDYGVARSWNIKFTIKKSIDSIFNFRPLHLYENGAILVRALKRGMLQWGTTCRVFIHQDENTGLQELSYAGGHFCGLILYADSLVAPEIYR